MSVYMSLPSIIKQLHKLCDTKATGTMFVVSDQKRSATFSLKKGRIISLQCRLRFGELAIPEIATIKHGTYRFEQTSNIIRIMDLPANDEIFNKILSMQEQEDEDALSLPSEPVKTIPNSSVGQLVLTSKQKTAIEDILVEELGPMGSIVMDSIEACADIPAILTVIKNEIDSPDMIRSVTQQIKAILK